MSTTWRLIAGLAIVSIFAPATLADSPNLHVTANDASVSVRGASANAAILIIGFQRYGRGYEPVFKRVESIVSAGVDGRAELALKPLSVSDAFFVAVDLQSGAFGSAVPPGKRERGQQLPAAALLHGNRGLVEAVDINADYAYVVVVRPSAGAYAGTYGDGAPSDADGRADGHIRISPRNLQKIHGSIDLGDDLQDGDLVFAFPPHRMTFFAAVVKP